MMNADSLTQIVKIALAVIIIVVGVIIAAQLAGCVSLKYEEESGKESLSIVSFLKSVDGLRAKRNDEGYFEVVIDKTYSHDPTEAVMKLIKTYGKLYGLGLRFDPDWRSPLMPEQE